MSYYSRRCADLIGEATANKTASVNHSQHRTASEWSFVKSLPPKSAEGNSIPRNKETMDKKPGEGMSQESHVHFKAAINQTIECVKTIETITETESKQNEQYQMHPIIGEKDVFGEPNLEVDELYSGRCQNLLLGGELGLPHFNKDDLLAKVKFKLKQNSVKTREEVSEEKIDLQQSSRSQISVHDLGSRSSETFHKSSSNSMLDTISEQEEKTEKYLRAESDDEFERIEREICSRSLEGHASPNESYEDQGYKTLSKENLNFSINQEPLQNNENRNRMWVSEDSFRAEVVKDGYEAMNSPERGKTVKEAKSFWRDKEKTMSQDSVLTNIAWGGMKNKKFLDTFVSRREGDGCCGDIRSSHQKMPQLTGEEDGDSSPVRTTSGVSELPRGPPDQSNASTQGKEVLPIKSTDHPEEHFKTSVPSMAPDGKRDENIETTRKDGGQNKDNLDTLGISPQRLGCGSKKYDDVRQNLYILESRPLYTGGIETEKKAFEKQDDVMVAPPGSALQAVTEFLNEKCSFGVRKTTKLPAKDKSSRSLFGKVPGCVLTDSSGHLVRPRKPLLGNISVSMPSLNTVDDDDDEEEEGEDTHKPWGYGIGYQNNSRISRSQSLSHFKTTSPHAENASHTKRRHSSGPSSKLPPPGISSEKSLSLSLSNISPNKNSSTLQGARHSTTTMPGQQKHSLHRIDQSQSMLDLRNNGPSKPGQDKQKQRHNNCSGSLSRARHSSSPLSSPRARAQSLFDLHTIAEGSVDELATDDFLYLDQDCGYVTFPCAHNKSQPRRRRRKSTGMWGENGYSTSMSELPWSTPPTRHQQEWFESDYQFRQDEEWSRDPPRNSRTPKSSTTGSTSGNTSRNKREKKPTLGNTFDGLEKAFGYEWQKMKLTLHQAQSNSKSGQKSPKSPAALMHNQNGENGRRRHSSSSTSDSYHKQNSQDRDVEYYRGRLNSVPTIKPESARSKSQKKQGTEEKVENGLHDTSDIIPKNCPASSKTCNTTDGR